MKNQVTVSESGCVVHNTTHRFSRERDHYSAICDDGNDIGFGEGDATIFRFTKKEDGFFSVEAEKITIKYCETKINEKLNMMEEGTSAISPAMMEIIANEKIAEGYYSNSLGNWIAIFTNGDIKKIV